jgi:hypothetical protein
LTIFGPDISSFEAGLNLALMPDASFVFAKTTEGTYYTDPDYQGWRAQAAQLGKPFAWYHFLTDEDVHAQVAHLLDKVGDKTLPGMLDVEPQPQTGSRPTLAQTLAFADAAHAAGLNLRLTYLPHWYWAELGSPSLSGLTSRGLYLVSSQYPGGTGNPEALYPGDSAAGWQPYYSGGPVPLFYQYTDKASDGGKSEDFNAFRGTVAQLLSFLQASVSTGGIDDVTPQDIQAIAAAVYAYGREDVNVSTGVMHNAPLGNLAHGAWVSVNDPDGPVMARLAALEEQNAALAGQVTELQTQNTALTAQVTALTGQTTALTAAVKTLSTPTVDEDALAAKLVPAMLAHVKIVAQ